MLRVLRLVVDCGWWSIVAGGRLWLDERMTVD